MTALTMPQKMTVAMGFFLALSCLFCFYRWHYGMQTAAADGLERLTAILRAESTLANRVNPKPESRILELSTPDLLARIQDMASSSEFRIKAIVPAPANPEELQATAAGDFRGAMRFLARLETLPVAITAFDLSQDENGDALLAVSLVKSPKPAAPASLADYIEALTQHSAVRDPFTPGDPIPLAGAGNELGDLSWTYHLSSISLLGAARVATIDGKDYEIGDILGNMKIVAIGPSSVTLEAPGKVLPQKLHFRRNPEARGRS
jgi:hypothetical protein